MVGLFNAGQGGPLVRTLAGAQLDLRSCEIQRDKAGLVHFSQRTLRIGKEEPKKYAEPLSVQTGASVSGGWVCGQKVNKHRLPTLIIFLLL